MHVFIRRTSNYIFWLKKFLFYLLSNIKFSIKTLFKKLIIHSFAYLEISLCLHCCSFITTIVESPKIKTLLRCLMIRNWSIVLIIHFILKSKVFLRRWVIIILLYWFVFWNLFVSIFLNSIFILITWNNHLTCIVYSFGYFRYCLKIFFNCCIVFNTQIRISSIIYNKRIFCLF